MTLYHVAKPDGTRMGPYDTATLQTMLESGQLTIDCLVWTEGWADWKPITTVVAPPLTATPAAEWGMRNAVKSVLFARYATFTGRASRSEYWWFFLAQVLFSFVFTIAGIALALILGVMMGEAGAAIGGGICVILLLLTALALIVPNIAVSVRRLHDAGYSGWFYLLGFAPYVGGIILFIFALLPSAPPNQWGTGPDKPAK